jgi:hypothetical protein
VQSDVYDNLSESVMTKGHCPDLIGFIHKVEQFQSKFAPQPRRLRILVKTTAFAVSLLFLRESSDNILISKEPRDEWMSSVVEYQLRRGSLMRPRDE